MEFLMILSALLSAVTGAFVGPRPDGARVHQPAAAQSVAAATPSVMVALPAARVTHAPPRRDQAVVALPAPASPPPASPPLETDRLLE